jgi:hypothetical protein
MTDILDAVAFDQNALVLQVFAGLDVKNTAGFDQAQGRGLWGRGGGNGEAKEHEEGES